MNEWKEIQIDNLPPDILTGDYEFEYFSNGHWLVNHRIEKRNIEERGATLYNAISKYRYRKPEPKTPTHKEIVTKWWKRPNGGWYKVKTYYPEDKNKYGLDGYVYSKDWFIGKQSADIPPESE